MAHEIENPSGNELASVLQCIDGARLTSLPKDSILSVYRDTEWSRNKSVDSSNERGRLDSDRFFESDKSFNDNIE